MWYKDKEWLYFVNDIIASDMPSAVFLATFIRHKLISGNYIASLEVIDLHKNKIIKKEHKVREAIYKSARVPFVFIVCKN